MGAPYPPVPNVAQVLLRGTTPGELWENVLHLQYSGPAPTASTLNAIAGTINTMWQGQIASLCPSPIVLTEVLVTDLGSTTGAQGVNTFVVTGTRGDDIMAANAAVLVSYPVSLRYRGGKPRSYLLVGGNADNQDGMNWHAAFVTEVKTKWTNFMNGTLGQGSGGTTFNQWCAVRRTGRYLANSGPPHYILTNPIVMPVSSASIIVHGQIASQKGRIGRRSK